MSRRLRSLVTNGRRHTRAPSTNAAAVAIACAARAATQRRAEHPTETPSADDRAYASRLFFCCSRLRRRLVAQSANSRARDAQRARQQYEHAARSLLRLPQTTRRRLDARTICTRTINDNEPQKITQINTKIFSPTFASVPHGRRSRRRSCLRRRRRRRRRGRRRRRRRRRCRRRR